MEQTRPAPFKVIIAGGSVMGLAMANALEQASIDYIVLEKREIAPSIGASIAIYPHIAKILEQLGVWRAVTEATYPLLRRVQCDYDGTMYINSAVPEILGQASGRNVRFMDRKLLLDALYNKIVDKSKIRERVGVESYTETETGVVVTTDGGETVEGSILIGADGVHSHVRQLLTDAIAMTDPECAEAKERAFTCDYATYFGVSKNEHRDDPSKQLIANSCAALAYGKNQAVGSIGGAPGKVFWFIFTKLPAQQRTPNVQRFTEAEKEATVMRFKDVYAGPGFTFGDLWAKKIKGDMVPMEEGILPGPWNTGGRVVLMGDSIHKYTVNAGLGANQGIEGVCYLTNGLYELLKRTPNPTANELVEVFNAFEAKERERAEKALKISYWSTRIDTEATWWLWFVRKFLLPWIPDRWQAASFVNFIVQGPKLAFLPDPDVAAPAYTTAASKSAELMG